MSSTASVFRAARHRVTFLLVLLSALSASAARGQTREAGGDEPSRPNILFVYSDDHAAHAISAYGSKINQTPNIDRLAEEGMRFDHFFVGNSICVPARGTILTGKHSHLHGALNIGDRFEPSQMTFPKLLQEAGYQTAVVGKWHLQSDPTGFDYWNVLIDQGPYYNPPMIENGRRQRHIGYTTDIITDITLDWLKNKRDADKPFMLMYQHKAPHRAWVPGPDHLDTFDDQTIPEPDTLFDDWSDRASPARLQEMTVANHMSPVDLMLMPPGYLTDEQRAAWQAAFGEENEAFREADLRGRERERWHYQRYIKDYLRCVQGIDDGLGEVLAYLDEAGLAEDTIVIYSSDQGFFLGDHGWYDKRFMYEESLRTPFIVRWPGVVEPGSVDGHLTQNIDVAQTFLEMAGVEAPEETERMQGRSLVPLMRGQEPGDWRDAIYYHYYDFPAVHAVRKHYGVRDERYKLINYYDMGEWELFDLEEDPDELHNVYDDPAYADVVKRMKQRMRELQQQYGDTNPDAPNGEVYREAYKRLAGEVRPQLLLELEGEVEVGTVPEAEVDTAAKPFLVGGWCEPADGDGVMISQGGNRSGYSIYLKDGRPHFAVRSAGVLREVAGEKPLAMDAPAHLMGRVDADGKLTLHVDGRPVASGPGLFLTAVPLDPLIVGDDRISPVAEYETPMPFAGTLRDLRVYAGVPAEEELAEWATRDD